MYKLMVVDDEYNIRDGISNAIPWADHNIEVVAQASNAMEALSKFEQFHPDIVITDIIMDDMTGLDLIENLYIQNHNVKFIIISGYDDFEYTKRAIKLKVFSYVLKPIVTDELLTIVDNLVKDIEEGHKIREKLLSLEDELEKNRSFILEKFLVDLIKGRITDENELSRRSAFLDIKFDYLFYLCLSFKIDNYYELVSSRSVKEIQIIILGIKRVIIEVLGSDYMALGIENDQTDITTIIGSNYSNKDTLLMELHCEIEKIKDTIKELFEITVTVGVGRVYNNILNIRKSFLEAGKAIEYRVVAGKDTIIDIDDIVSISGSKYIYPKDKEKLILNSIGENDLEKVNAYIYNFFMDLQTQNCLKDQIKAAVLQLIMVVSSKFMDMGMNAQEDSFMGNIILFYDQFDKLDTIEDIKVWIIKAITNTVNDINLGRNSDVKNIISKAQRYIQDYFSDYSISLQTISGYVHLSPAYFSKLYKKETGDSYIDFITKIRIEKAKEYLKQTNMRISDIGASVGYPNAHYFSTLFKKNIGITPAEYRML